MNIFRLSGDLLHLLSFIIIIYKLLKHKNSKGISSKTQEIYLLIFCTRYLDLFMYYISLYNTIMKILFILVTIYIICLIQFHPLIKNTYNRELDDNFQHYYILPVSIVLTIIVHKGLNWWDLLWSLSVWLEVFAIVPQIDILNKQKTVENFTAHYIASLGMYKFFYILNWIYRFFYENYLCWTSIISGIVQVLLYVDFLYLYLKNLKENLSSDLPISAKIV